MKVVLSIAGRLDDADTQAVAEILKKCGESVSRLDSLHPPMGKCYDLPSVVLEGMKGLAMCRLEVMDDTVNDDLKCEKIVDRIKDGDAGDKEWFLEGMSFSDAVKEVISGGVCARTIPGVAITEMRSVSVSNIEVRHRYYDDDINNWTDWTDWKPANDANDWLLPDNPHLLVAMKRLKGWKVVKSSVD